MKERKANRFLAVLMVLAMMAGMFAGVHLNTVKAADSEAGETTSSGIDLSKTATLEDDGTYTINLEAYATGTTTTTTTTSSVPLDIVLVIDQSGSMAQNDSGSSTNTESDRRYYKLKNALNSFVSAIQQNAASTGANHRIAIAGFASDNDAGRSTTVTGAAVTSGSDNFKWVNTGLYINGTMTPYGTNQNNTNTSLTATNYQNALVSANSNGAVASSISTAITNMKFSGGTYTEYGLLMAQGVFANNSATYTKEDGTEGTRKRIVILFTDGATNSTISDVLTASNTLKSTYGATVYCVGFGSSVGDFLSYISSNYGSDASYSTGSLFSSASYSGTSNNTTKYSMLATSTDELSKIFETISTDVSQDSTTVTLDANSVMKDIMGDGFTLTDASTVTIKTVAGTSDGSTITWGDETNNSASYEISSDKTTVSVTGFNYADKYISSGHSGEKICVTITGVLPTEDVVTGSAVSTNSSLSGIYASAEAESAAAYFPVPETIITKKVYVLDYAKTASLTDLEQTSITNIVSSFQKVSSSTNTTLTQAFGKTILLDSKLTYTPTAMRWNGYDSFYVFGQTTNETVMSYTTNTAARKEESDTGTANLWSKVSVIPANNVYYEDDFITTSTDGTTSTGTVGIVYTGDWTVVGASNNNTETANGGTYGWETSLSDDAAYSDGSAHQVDAKTTETIAQAKFTFTGTGIDIYSRTDLTTGTVVAYLTGTSESNSETAITKTLIVDNLAESVGAEGAYYQIPTVSFNGLEYGTYSVTLTVTTAAEERTIYYLDGIRVYNPLGTVEESDDDAYEAYKADNELNAVFTEVRDILIDVNSFTGSYNGAGGVVFIDNNVTNDGETGDPDNTTSTIGTYKSYGPDNEVYLAAGQSIAFKVSGGDNYYLGIKAPNGNTTATVTNGTGTSNLTISAASDLYYEITPTSDGYIMVKNSGSNLLSITKLRTTSTASAESGIALLNVDEVNEILVYASGFDSLTKVAYISEAEEEDAETETDETVEELDEDDIIIDNPTDDAEEQQADRYQDLFSKVFDTIRKWFNGGR